MVGQLLLNFYGNGFLSRKEFDRARDALTIRTQTVHGFVPKEIDSSLIEDLLNLARKVKGSEEVETNSVAV